MDQIDPAVIVSMIRDTAREILLPRFAEVNRTRKLALIDQGESQYRVVYDPIRDESFYAIAGQGDWLNKKRLLIPQSSQPIAY
jgi:hypothetical protein